MGANGSSGTDCDVVVVGGGAAGLSAALLLVRARRRVVVVDGSEPRNAPAAHVQGFLTRDGVEPTAFLEAGRAEVTGYGGRIVRGLVDTAVPLDGGFAVLLDDGDALRARRLVVATGLRDELPGIPGVRERWGRDVLHCPYCHGYEVRDRPVGVLGTSPGAVFHAQLVRQWSDDVVLFAHTLDLSDEDRVRLDARGVRVVEGVVSRVRVVDDVLRGVEVDGEVVAREAVFVVPRMVPRDSLLTGLGCAVGEGGWVTVDRSGLTSVPGVWAAGNVVDPRALVVTSAGMGSAAGFAVNVDLVEEDVAEAMAVGAGR
ncbi:NAD(P)/FAD-dependent oxidoreductase [Saccharothrix algeriensis]|nr:NAD(P)/FAD-dependent oxidoreductase [Saccharothrix algeriensis]MBM7815133.1 thioredoxin reductase [Saccharothrix algeriensis]QTR03381.1 NAD(P)/FAD-dependent oxidoreductase [Saccharothrix algeriensis]